MPKFSKSSLDKLNTCHPDLIKLMLAVIEKMDVTILCGHRGEEEQNRCFQNRTSMLRWPHGKHNKVPSLAVDCAPWPIDWGNVQAFKRMGEVVKETAKEIGVDIEWGGDWPKFRDLPHIQLKEK